MKMTDRIKKIAAFSVVTALILSVSIYDAPFAYAEGKDTPADSSALNAEADPDELIVVYEASETDDADDAAEKLQESVGENADIKDADIKDIEPVTDSVGEDGACVLVQLDDDADADDVKETLEDQDGVAYVQPNFRYRMMDAITTDDTYFNKLYHLKPWDSTFESQCGANVTGAWEMMGGICDDENAEPVKIAILDSGCQTTHEDLTDAVDMEHAYDAVEKLQGAEYVSDQSGHGTHVSGIAAGVADNGKGIAGASGNYAKIIPINVFDGEWSRTTDMLTAFGYLEELMNIGEIENLHVINMSLGGYGEADASDKALEQYINRMRKKDVLTVCAGGNGDDSTGLAYKDNPIYPGDFDACLCVTSLDRNGTNSVFSDYSMDKDISAPGSLILSTMADETDDTGDDINQKYAYISGTSMASPLVAGIAALIWADNSELTADQVFESITETAAAVNPAVNDHTGETGSSGAIDAAAAIHYARERFDTKRTWITEANVAIEASEWAFDGTPKEPKVSVTCDGVELSEGTDYLVSYNNNVDPGTGAVSVTGIKDYIGTVTKDFEIGKADIADAEVTMSPASFDFDGEYHFPSKITVSMHGTTLKWGKDFTITALTDGIQAGKHTIEISGKGNYDGVRQDEYTIVADDDEGGDDQSQDDQGGGNTDPQGGDQGDGEQPSGDGQSDGQPSDGSGNNDDDKKEDGSSDQDGQPGQQDGETPTDGSQKDQGGSSDGSGNGDPDDAGGNSGTVPPSGNQTDPSSPDGNSSDQGTPTIEPPDAPWEDTGIIAAGLRKVKGLKVSVKGRKFTLSWKKTTGAGGYQVQYRLKGKKKWSVLKKTSGCKVRSRKLKRGKSYQFRVRTYNKISGRMYYGRWTGVKTKKCR